MKKKILVTAVSAVVTLTILSACSVSTDQHDPDPATPPTTEAGQLEEITVTGNRATRIETGSQAGDRRAPPEAQSSQTLSRRVFQRINEVMEARDAASADSAGGNAAVASGAMIINRAPAMSRRHIQLPATEDRENYAVLDNNTIKRVGDEPVSTFSIDVDTASYSNVRRFISAGHLPPADAVRTEEMVNYFTYDYPRAGEDDAPFAVFTEVSASPWSPGKHLLHIGLQAVDPDQAEDPPANLVFLVDVSGSMNSPDKLGLLQASLKLLATQLDADDRVSLVVYAGASGVVLEPTPGNQTRNITGALERLHAGGSTNGAAGIELAYQLAADAFIEGGINRVILATDGDFNVGVSDVDSLKDLISTKRNSGISLTTLGFGTGNINDHLMEQLADNGNGNYAYIDTLNEARKVLVDEMSSTLRTVAKDVKVQIEFNPAVVAEYRLVGYENRLLDREDFNNDRIDAGEIGAGHTVTALYEISLVGSGALSVDPYRYSGNRREPVEFAGDAAEFAFLKLRYKAPDADTSVLIEHPLLVSDIRESIEDTSADYRFSAAVAGFAQLLKQDTSLGSFTYDDVLILAQPARGNDAFGYRAEFINMVRTASALN